MNSVLNDIKKLLSIHEDNTAFDDVICIHINSVFSLLSHIGASEEGQFFTITDYTATWDDYIKGKENVELLKSFIYFKVRLMFDPPNTTFGISAFEKMASEYEWRLSTLEGVFKSGNTN